MGRGRGTKGGTRGRGRGRGRKSSRIISSDEENRTDSLEIKEDKSEPQEENDQQMADAPEIVIPVEEIEKVHEEPIPHKIDMEGDISQLEAPTFTTITRNIPQPMTQLNWDHKVNLIGHKVLSPMIHCCDQCNKPILIYGRMIPCKHVFCLKCARAENYKTCPRCHDKVNRVEKTGFPIYLCTHGGTLYGSTGCRRTYLSQRDLQAHINHRHLPSQTIQESKLIVESKASNTPTSNPPIQPSHPKKDLLTTHSHAPQSQMTIPSEPTKQFHSLTASHLSNSLQSQSTSRNNLIVTPIQEPHQNSRSIVPENPQLGHNVYYNQLQQNLPYTSGGIANNQPNQQPSNFYAHSYGQHVGQHYQQQQGANVQPQWNQQQYYR